MELRERMFVRSRAGRDKDRIYVIAQACGEYVFLTDGDKNPLCHLKRKNRRHLQPILKKRFEGPFEDRAVREAVKMITPSGDRVRRHRQAEPEMQEDQICQKLM